MNFLSTSKHNKREKRQADFYWHSSRHHHCNKCIHQKWQGWGRRSHYRHKKRCYNESMYNILENARVKKEAKSLHN